ncbi:MAG TPA: beta-lactamase family protein [Candidatus Acutalibacter pullistercoris]|uniref:Beta-lactamase family protein n=1 Tax=Candidatus Acutalibacter pullistercoris TaxID=2838418 RepID=A0A9D1YB00_9FIRM|nr:beta-lactamase family protein [Candidatus Acutalibacter pullistercoris]
MNWDAFDERAKALGLLNLQVWKDGEIALRRDYDGEIRRNQYSASKSFTSAAVGIALREGLLSLEEPLVEAFPEELPEDPCENLRKARVRDLLTMCLGQGQGYLMGEQRPFLTERDWVKYSLSLPFPYAPGEKFVYNNVGPYLAGVLVQRRAGCHLVSYLTPRLFAPLGIQRPTWETDPLGYTFGAGGLFLCVTELGKFGQLLLQKGEWEGRQLVPREYLEQATAKQVENGEEGYGYLFWRGKDNSYRADGKYGQYAIVLEEEGLLLACNAQCPQQRELLDFLLGERHGLLKSCCE